ncbi:VOC family protein [Caulobacter hibisci]|uniref:VOC family protein n=1 Tax=Caulobacter hibisci TaxID=2035993 RepID=A0ABS0SRY9_9CAUL|nr:VOC family protein [Caulobacter hibisci]MBI1682323.1 VOC family protein [Caulobacter hibisci]
MSGFSYGFHHGGISVPDLDAAIEWYGRVLGFSLERRFPIPTIPAEVAMIANGDLRIELFEVPGAAPLPDDRRIPDRDVHTHGVKHVAFVAPDVVALTEELKARGADIVWLKVMPHATACFIRDLAGNLIEFVQGPVPTGESGRL